VIKEHPVVARYMATFGAAIKGIDAEEHAAIEQEIHSHIAEATAAGKRRQLATLIVATILGSVGITFTATGLAAIMVGMLETSGIHLPGVELNGVPPGWVVASGPLMIVIGLAAFVLLRSYIRFVGRAMRKTLPRAGNELARA
jgi:hypothetical protein